MNQIETWSLPPFKAGQSIIMDITVMDGDDPLQLVNAWAACTFRDRYGGTEFFTVDSDGSGIVISPLTGLIHIEISPSQTLLLNSTGIQTKGVFDVKLIIPPFTDYPVYDGRWVCYPSSTIVEPS